MKMQMRVLGMVIFFVMILNVSASVTTQLGADIDGEAAGDQCGGAVSLSADGTRVAIGAMENDNTYPSAGHARVFEYSGGVWSQMGSDIDGETDHAFNGTSVSLSADGARVAIGAYGANYGKGYARVFEYSGGNWIQMGSDIDGVAELDNCGRSVSLSADGTRVAVGSPSNAGGGSLSGHVRIFEYSGGNWIQMGFDINGEASGDRSGYSVSLSADGIRMAVGADGNDGNGSSAGHVRIFEFVTNTWVQLGTDIDGDAESDNSGEAVSLSADGTRVAIGGPHSDVVNPPNDGHIRIFEYSSSDWIQVGQKIVGAADADYFGCSVSLSSDGSRLAVGAKGHDGSVSGYDFGHTQIYEYFNGTWVQVALDIDGEADGDYSGGAVSLNADGTCVAIGAAYGNYAQVFSIDPATMYVDIHSTNSVPPYISWETAATEIQDAVGMAFNDDVVMITDGIYLDPVNIQYEITVQSVNGASKTFLTNSMVQIGDVDCLFEGITVVDSFMDGISCASTLPTIKDCVISGADTGIQGGTATNCIITGNLVGMYQGDAKSCAFRANSSYGIWEGTASNCTISESSIGVYSATVTDCTIVSNYNVSSTLHGCGMRDASAYNCLIAENYAEGLGAGAYNSTVSDCVIRDNISFQSGGGLYASTAYRCEIIGNAAAYDGGGLCGDHDNITRAYNCTIIDNYAGRNGGGVYGSYGEDYAKLYNCTVIDNYAENAGSALYAGWAANCIIYHDQYAPVLNLFSNAPDIRFSCTPELTHGALGNITNAPSFVNGALGNYRLSSLSPCMDAGLNVFMGQSLDLDGAPRTLNGTVDMGAYEYQGVSPDDDNDGVDNATEVRMGTDPNNPDSDGDGLDDGWEIAQGLDPLADNSDIVSYIETEFDLYPSNIVLDVALGEALLDVSGTNALLSLQLEQSEDLQTWTNAGDAVEWSVPVDTDKRFLRIRSAP